MILLLRILSNHSVHNCLQDVFFWYYAFHVLNKIICLSSLLILQVVDDKIQPGLRNNVDERWQHLQGILAAAEDNEVVTEQVVVLEDVASSG